MENGGIHITNFDISIHIENVGIHNSSTVMNVKESFHIESAGMNIGHDNIHIVLFRIDTGWISIDNGTVSNIGTIPTK